MTSIGEDFILLRRYAERRDEAAFATLVRRYINMVHSAAARRVGERTLAEDVTQAVFLILAQKANSFREGTVLSAWLLKTVRYASVNALRIETRRRKRETQLATTAAGACSVNPMDVLIWSEIAQQLDDAVLRLPSEDRRAVLMRYFQDCPISQIAHELSVTEETARKRLSRAIEKLRQRLNRSGAMLPVGGGVDLGVLLSTHVVRAVPSGLVQSACATVPSRAIAGGAANIIAKGAIKMMNWTRIKIAAGIATVAAVVGTGTIVTVNRGFAQVPAATQTSSTPAAPSTAPSTPQLAEIMTGLRQSEHAIHTLYIKNFRTTVEISGKGKDDWQATPIVFSGSAWLDESPRGAARVFYTEHVMEGDQGAPPIVQSLDLSWNGKEGRQIQIVQGTRRTTERSALITSDRPMLLSERFGGYECGSAYSVQYLVTVFDGVTPEQPHRMLSDGMEKDLQQGAMPKITQEKVDDFDTVRLTCSGRTPFGAYSISYWFAPSCGYALIKSEEDDGLPNQRPFGITVKKLKQIAPGVWFPLQAQGILNNAGRSDQSMRYTYEAEDATANSTQWDKTVFAAKIPTGYLVYDHSQQPERNYVLLPGGSQAEMHIGSVVPMVHQEAPVSPDANGHTP